MRQSDGLKVGDFVTHRKMPKSLFQIVQILQSVRQGDPAMLKCVPVREISSYPENEVMKYELTHEDRDRITDGGFD